MECGVDLQAGWPSCKRIGVAGRDKKRFNGGEARIRVAEVSLETERQELVVSRPRLSQIIALVTLRLNRWLSSPADAQRMVSA